MSAPGRYPAPSTASTIRATASSLPARSGAKPPSSPIPVDLPRALSSPRRAWKVSTPIRSASANDGALWGAILNSWKSTVLSAWRPPLMTFRHGTGRTAASAPPKCRYNGTPDDAAAARAAAIDTPRRALAPSRALFGVPSSAISRSSIRCWSAASQPISASAISPLTWATARRTPLPP